MTDDTDAQVPQPDPALQRLQPLVGTWTMKGHFIGSEEENITGQATFEWLDGGFFMQQDVEIDLAGQVHVKSRELIGFDPETGAFASHVDPTCRPRPCPTNGTFATAS